MCARVSAVASELAKGARRVAVCQPRRARLLTPGPSPGRVRSCQDTWLGDGACDLTCNTTRCMFDGGDCINATITVKSASSSSSYSGKGARYTNTAFTSSSTPATPQPPEEPPCAPGCPVAWLGDLMCDDKCSSSACGWDGADCGISKVLHFLPGVAAAGNITVEPDTLGYRLNVPGDSSDGAPPSWIWEHTAALVLSEIAQAQSSGAADNESTVCGRMSANASWLADRILRNLGNLELQADPLRLDTSVLSAYVNLSTALHSAQVLSATDLVAVSALLQSGQLYAVSRAMCDSVVLEPSCKAAVQSAGANGGQNSNAVAGTLVANTSGYALNTSSATLPSSLDECLLAASTALVGAWNTSAYVESVSRVRAMTRSARTITGAEFASSDGVKSSVLSAPYDLLLVLFNGDTLDALAPVVPADRLRALLPSPSPLPSRISAQRPFNTPANASFGNGTNASSSTSSELSPSFGVNMTDLEAEATRRRDAILQLSPLVSVGDAAFAIHLKFDLLFPNATAEQSLSVSRRLMFNTTLFRRSRIDFSSASASNSSNRTSDVDASHNGVNSTYNNTSAAVGHVGITRRRMNSAPVTGVVQGIGGRRAGKESHEKSTIARETRETLRLARVAADVTLARLAEPALSDSASLRSDATRRAVAAAWAAVKDAVDSADAADSLNPLELYPELDHATDVMDDALAGRSVWDAFIGCVEASLSRLASYWSRDAQPLSAGVASPLSRRLGEDTYADSLVFTTRLIASRLGRKSSRRVPAHMPHMIDRVISKPASCPVPYQFDHRCCCVSLS